MSLNAPMLNMDQERELEKVNAFYLQKEAEVYSRSSGHRFTDLLSDVRSLAQNPPQDPPG